MSPDKKQLILSDPEAMIAFGPDIMTDWIMVVGYRPDVLAWRQDTGERPETMSLKDFLDELNTRGRAGWGVAWAWGKIHEARQQWRQDNA